MICVQLPIEMWCHLELRDSLLCSALLCSVTIESPEFIVMA
ncbi:hypothetical protein SynPROS71_01736 [Synechococcus sp. PROS-7-1]|nr:hypothetical protein SynPROS71_01736 [Synechococcus sp. PROS-7-1]